MSWIGLILSFFFVIGATGFFIISVSGAGVFTTSGCSTDLMLSFFFVTTGAGVLTSGSADVLTSGLGALTSSFGSMGLILSLLLRIEFGDDSAGLSKNSKVSFGISLMFSESLGTIFFPSGTGIATCTSGLFISCPGWKSSLIFIPLFLEGPNNLFTIVFLTFLMFKKFLVNTTGGISRFCKETLQGLILGEFDEISSVFGSLPVLSFSVLLSRPIFIFNLGTFNLGTSEEGCGGTFRLWWISWPLLSATALVVLVTNAPNIGIFCIGFGGKMDIFGNFFLFLIFFIFFSFSTGKAGELFELEPEVEFALPVNEILSLSGDFFVIRASSIFFWVLALLKCWANIELESLSEESYWNLSCPCCSFLTSGLSTCGSGGAAGFGTFILIPSKGGGVKGKLDSSICLFIPFLFWSTKFVGIGLEGFVFNLFSCFLKKSRIGSTFRDWHKSAEDGREGGCSFSTGVVVLISGSGVETTSGLETIFAGENVAIGANFCCCFWTIFSSLVTLCCVTGLFLGWSVSEVCNLLIFSVFFLTLQISLCIFKDVSDLNSSLQNWQAKSCFLLIVGITGAVFLTSGFVTWTTSVFAAWTSGFAVWTSGFGAWTSGVTTRTSNAADLTTSSSGVLTTSGVIWRFCWSSLCILTHFSLWIFREVGVTNSVPHSSHLCSMGISSLEASLCSASRLSSFRSIWKREKKYCRLAAILGQQQLH